MTTIQDLGITQEEMDQHVAEGLVKIQTDPSGTLFVHNYTAKTQYSRAWNHVTKQCRGLITNQHGEIVARPFTKFLNLGEHDGNTFAELPVDQPFDVLRKADGSLGVLHTAADGRPAIATRGSFTSDQAQWATKWWTENAGFAAPAGATLLFEIVYPANRIVVDYGDFEGLILLAAIDIATGKDLPLSMASELGWTGQVIETIPGLSDLDAVREFIDIPKANDEGVVLRFHNDSGPSLRCKVKYAEYVRLHRILTGVSNKAIWEVLSTGGSLEPYLDNVPDEFYAYVRRTHAGLRESYDVIEREAHEIFRHRPANADRKTTAEYFADRPHRAVLFKMLDDKPYADLIWKAIKPAYEKPFLVDEDA